MPFNWLCLVNLGRLSAPLIAIHTIPFFVSSNLSWVIFLHAFLFAFPSLYTKAPLFFLSMLWSLFPSLSAPIPPSLWYRDINVLPEHFTRVLLRTSLRRWQDTPAQRINSACAKTKYCNFLHCSLAFFTEVLDFHATVSHLPLAQILISRMRQRNSTITQILLPCNQIWALIKFLLQHWVW